MYKMFTRDAGKYFVEIILYASNPPNVNNGMRTTLQIVRLTRKDGLFSSAKCSHRIFASLILSCMVFQVFNHLLNFLAVQKLRRYSRITSTVKVTSNDKKIMVNIRFVEVPLVTWRGVTWSGHLRKFNKVFNRIGQVLPWSMYYNEIKFCLNFSEGLNAAHSITQINLRTCTCANKPGVKNLTWFKYANDGHFVTYVSPGGIICTPRLPNCRRQNAKKTTYKNANKVEIQGHFCAL